MMHDAPEAQRALRYLRELSPAVRDAAVLAADGAVLAGRPPARDPGGGLLLVRADGERAAVAATIPAGPLAAIARLDAAAAVLVAGGGGGETPAPEA